MNEPEQVTADERAVDKPKKPKRDERGAAAADVERAVVTAPERR